VLHSETEPKPTFFSFLSQMLCPSHGDPRMLICDRRREHQPTLSTTMTLTMINDRPSLVPKLSVTLHSDNFKEWHRRILLNLCKIVVKDGVSQLNEKIFYFYSPTLGSLGLRVGCCDCISMTKSVSGDSLLYDENGKAHRFQHGAANVDGCATLVCQYRYFASDGRSDLATRDCQPPSQSNSISFGTNLITESSIDEMVSQNVFRIVDSTPQKVALLRLLVSAGLEIFKVPLNMDRLQQAIDASLPNEFFIDRFSSNPKQMLEYNLL